MLFFVRSALLVALLLCARPLLGAEASSLSGVLADRAFQARVDAALPGESAGLAGFATDPAWALVAARIPAGAALEGPAGQRALLDAIAAAQAQAREETRRELALASRPDATAEELQASAARLLELRAYSPLLGYDFAIGIDDALRAARRRAWRAKGVDLLAGARGTAAALAPLEEPPSASMPRASAARAPRSLLRKQAATQSEKERARTVEDYENYLFPRDSRERSATPNASALAALYDTGGVAPLLAALGKAAGRPPRWADFGGGLAVAMRELARSGKLPAGSRLTNVDLFDWARGGAEGLLGRAAYELGSDVFQPAYAPALRREDAATVRFAPKERPDLITMVESLQYAPDKLATIANAYNQLAEGGVLVIAADAAWMPWIRRDGEEGFGESALTSLARAGVPMLAWKGAGDRLGRAATVVLQRVPGTRLRVRARLDHTWTNPHGYVASYYKAARTAGAALRLVGPRPDLSGLSRRRPAGLMRGIDSFELRRGGQPLEALGRGADGMVFAHPNDDAVALKGFFRRDGRAAARDAATQSALAHAGLAPRLLAETRVGGMPLLAFERVKGKNLLDLIMSGAFGKTERALVHGLIARLAAARLRPDDLRLQNIMLGSTPTDPRRRAYLVDGGRLRRVPAGMSDEALERALLDGVYDAGTFPDPVPLPLGRLLDAAAAKRR